MGWVGRDENRPLSTRTLVPTKARARIGESGQGKGEGEGGGWPYLDWSRPRARAAMLVLGLEDGEATRESAAGH